MFTIILMFSGCAGDGVAMCERPDTWRNEIDVSSGSAEVVITEGCDYALVVTEADLIGAGFDADLPLVGDTVDTESWVVTVTFSADEPGTYSGSLYIAAENLLADSLPQELFATVD